MSLTAILDGIAMLEIPYTCVPDSAANAEFELIFT